MVPLRSIAPILMIAFTCYAQAEKPTSQPQSSTYSALIVNNFNAACVDSGGSIDYCNCMINEISQQLTQTEYLEEETFYVKTGKLSDKFSKVMMDGLAKCVPSQ